MWGVVVTSLIAIAIAKIGHWLYRWQNPKCNGRLPPGSMGLPFIGETFELFKPYGFYEVMPFIKKRMDRYGSLSRTCFLGVKTIVSTDPDVNFEIFKQEDKAFALGYPDAALKMFGESNLFTKQGTFHKYIKQVSLQLLGLESLRKGLIHVMDEATQKGLEAAAANGMVEAKKLTEQVILDVLTKRVMINMPAEVKEEIRRFRDAFGREFFNIAFNLAWKSLRECISGRKKGTDLMKDMIKERRRTKAKYGDFIDTLIEEMEKEGSILNEDNAVQLIFALPLVASDSTAAASALAVKFITENPKVYEELKRENEMILQNRENGEGGLTWEEYKTMTFTQMVINETQRLATIAPFMLRKAVHDVEFNGYTIPAGWHVLVAPSVVHFDPEKYADPALFNPWRWEDPKLRSGMAKYLMVFGGGARLCAGAEYAKLQMALLIHHLVTKYRWHIAKGGEVYRAPTVKFPNGIHIKISRASH